MKYFTLSIFIFISLTIAAYSQEDIGEESSLEFSLSAGIPFSYTPEEFSDGWKQGRNIGIGGGLVFPAGDLGYSTVYLTIENANFSYDEAGLAEWKTRHGIALQSSHDDLNVTSFFIDYKGTFAGSRNSIAPYFLIGIGVNSVADESAYLIDSVGTPINDIKDGLGIAWRAGAGIDVPLVESLAIFGEGKFIVAVNKFQYFTLGGGIRWKL
ncbi:MAG: hypothetical protein EPO24_03480 [Bacteroidetes bacterium]|nr:MAG: hypothetical protein EPO24_03480 [Bacteroidota bacterium]